MKCSICGKEIVGYGNSGIPATTGIVCDYCNSQVVVPIRVFMRNQETQRNVAILIKETSIDLVCPKDKKYFKLDQLQKCVDGGIELAPEKFDSNLIVVNDEGLLRGLLPNQLAKLLFNVDYVGNVLIVPQEIFEAPEE